MSGPTLQQTQADRAQTTPLLPASVMPLRRIKLLFTAPFKRFEGCCGKGYRAGADELRGSAPGTLNFEAASLQFAR